MSRQDSARTKCSSSVARGRAAHPRCKGIVSQRSICAWIAVPSLLKARFNLIVGRWLGAQPSPSLVA
eukprot:170846-Pyramimonas_sp.AAC.1